MTLRSTTTVGAIAALMLLLSACAPEPATDGRDDPPAADAPTAEAEAGDGAEDAGAQGVVGVDFPDPDDVIADATFTVPGEPGQELRVGIESLAVRDGVTELRLVLTPLWTGSDIRVYDMLGGAFTGSNLKLVDIANLKEYGVLSSGPHLFMSDPVTTRTASQTPVGFQAFFPTPEDDVDAFDVVIDPSWPSFQGVPLTRED
ncbi:hypothetical protein [Microbacterium album]|uniref:DUF4352 domain-containing protein n=1 Tax=Microbacterium album TaxID=2053191 RepID=A0A917IF97_9MICO|nr:hypothetical protein [Microbacterium album]GGH47680.1 hypothetical protein GCM10010921_24610 [Microbacterium album]